MKLGSTALAAVLCGATLLTSTTMTSTAAHAQESCGSALPSACLQRFGAGSLSAEPVEGVDCTAKMDAYRACISNVIATRQITPAFEPYTRAERGFLFALEAELADNVGRLEQFVEAKLDLTGATAVYENDWPALRLRFFNATDNPAYFVAPADWLARAQGFYDDVATMLAREDVRHAYRRQTTSVLYSRRVFRERFEELVSIGRDQLLPDISAELARSAQ